jgi:hypothetical protein
MPEAGDHGMSTIGAIRITRSRMVTEVLIGSAAGPASPRVNLSRPLI